LELKAKANERLELDSRSEDPSLDYWRPGFRDLGCFAEALRRNQLLLEVFGIVSAQVLMLSISVRFFNLCVYDQV
jgi:hypothetical protein